MISLNKNFNVDRPFLNFDCIPCRLPIRAALHDVSSQFFIIRPGKDSIITLKDSYLEMGFDVFKATVDI